MRCRHVVKYLTLLLISGSCLVWTAHLTGDPRPHSPSMLIPKCKFI